MFKRFRVFPVKSRRIRLLQRVQRRYCRHFGPVFLGLQLDTVWYLLSQPSQGRPWRSSYANESQPKAR